MRKTLPLFHTVRFMTFLLLGFAFVMLFTSNAHAGKREVKIYGQEVTLPGLNGFRFAEELTPSAYQYLMKQSADPDSIIALYLEKQLFDDLDKGEEMTEFRIITLHALRLPQIETVKDFERLRNSIRNIANRNDDLNTQNLPNGSTINHLGILSEDRFHFAQTVVVNAGSETLPSVVKTTVTMFLNGNILNISASSPFDKVSDTSWTQRNAIDLYREIQREND